MTLIWDIRMHQLNNGYYRVVIRGEGGRAVGIGPRPYDAYKNAELKLVIKPACDWMKP
jgi:hypothetical protein